MGLWVLEVKWLLQQNTLLILLNRTFVKISNTINILYFIAASKQASQGKHRISITNWEKGVPQNEQYNNVCLSKLTE